MRFGKKLAVWALGGLALLGLAAQTAKANSIYFYLTNPSTAPVTGTYIYDVSISAGSALISPLKVGSTSIGPAFGQVIDFAGLDQTPVFTPAALQPTTWTITTPTSKVAFGVSTPDDASVPNIVLSWSGTNTTPLQFANATLLGQLTAHTTLTGIQQGTYQSQDLNYSNNTPQGNWGFTEVPTAVPVPAAAWAGMSLLGIVLGIRAKLRKGQK